MSEGRQLALLLLGGLLLAIIGVGAATLFPEPCEDLEGIGTLELAFTDVADALPLEADVASTVEGLGEAAGIGPWRGAVALPPGTSLLPSDFGFFAVTDTDLVALRPGTGIASAPRDVRDVTVVGVGGTSAGLVTDDGRIGVFASDYERERCGSVPPDDDVLAVDRGVAVLDAGDELVVRTLSGEDVVAYPSPGAVTDAVLAGDVLAVAAERRLLEAVIRDEPSRLAPVGQPGEVLWAAGDRVVQLEPGAGATVVDRVVGAGAGSASRVAVDGSVVDAVPTPAGTVVLTEDALVTDRGGRVELPPDVDPVELHASQDGQVGLLVAGADDGPVLLTWGRDLPVEG